MRSTWVKGKEDRKSLGHRGRKLATRQAHELLSGILANEQGDQGRESNARDAQPDVSGEPQHQAKGEPGQREDKRKLDRVVAFVGADRNVLSLSESDVRRYTMARRAGNTSLEGVKPNHSDRGRAIEADLLALHRALNWAVRERKSSGQRLIPENPLRGIRRPRERNPKRPVMRHDLYLKLLEVASQVHPLLKLALVVAEGTGRRISAWRNLRWDDVDFQAGEIRWRAKFDKSGFEDVRLMSDTVRDALREARKDQRAIGSAPVFPAPKDPPRPCDRHLLDNWLRRAFPKAGLKQERSRCLVACLGLCHGGSPGVKLGG